MICNADGAVSLMLCLMSTIFQGMLSLIALPHAIAVHAFCLCFSDCWPQELPDVDLSGVKPSASLHFNCPHNHHLAACQLGSCSSTFSEGSQA